MIINLPNDAVHIERGKKLRKNRFSFTPSANRMALPTEIVELYPGTTYGIDIWVSRKEKSAYLKFVPKDKAYFKYGNKNGYVGCADLFRWFKNNEIPVFKDYDYMDYVVDKKNKLVKVSLVRK